MKKYFILAASILAAVSCSKENLNSENNTLPVEDGDLCGCTISATNSGSKTCIGTVSSDNISILWEEGDAVKVWDDKSGCEGHGFTMTSISEDHSGAKFSGEVHSLATNLTVVYPATGASGSLNTLNACIPATQTMKNGSFDSSAAVSIAHATRTPGQTEISGLSFKNLCSVICFSVPSYISKVVISANNGANIAGEATIENDVLSLNGSNASKTITVNTTASTAVFYAVIAPGTYTGGFKFDMTADNGATYTKSTSKEIPAQAGRIFNLGNLGLKLDIASVGIEHEYSSNVLQGSKITVNSGNDDKQKGLVKNWKVTLKKSGLADQVFNLASASASAGAYIPQGTYDVTLEYSFADGSSRTVEGLEAIVPAPKNIGAAVSAETSYSKYCNNDISGANSCDAGTIYNLTASISGVSSAVLAQSNIAYNVKSFVDNSQKSSTDTYMTSADNVSGNSWGAHTIKGVATFDGVEASKEETVYITGLPYSIKTESSSISGWTMGGGNFHYGDNPAGLSDENKYLMWAVVSRGETKNSYAISPAFCVPNNTNIAVSVPAYCYKGTTSMNYSYLYINASTSASKDGSAININQSGNYPAQASWTTANKNVTLTSSVNKVCVYASVSRTDKIWPCTLNVGIYTKSITIVYR